MGYHSLIGSGRKTNPRREPTVGVGTHLAAGGGIRMTSAGLHLGVAPNLALVKLWPGSRGTLGISRSLAAGKTITRHALSSRCWLLSRRWDHRITGGTARYLGC